MWFEGRELKPYAEPVDSDELREGQVYFSVTYVDEDMLFPMMETLVFIGRNLEKGDTGRLYFQDVHSYAAGRRRGDPDADDYVDVSLCREGQTKHIFEFEKALEGLMGCSLRRRAKLGDG